MNVGFKNKGFTLIELLVVIGIVAILAVVVILTLNPAELLKQARDSNRISDMNTLKSALSVYLADVSTPSLGSTSNCYMSATSTNPGNCGWNGARTATSSTSTAVDSTGWVPVNFTLITSGSPFGSLPKDPTNVSPYVYRYAPSSSNTFALMAPLESSKYTSTTSAAANDGGVSSTAYEAGTALNN